LASLAASLSRHWHQSLGFRLRIWLVGLVIVIGVASLSVNLALIVGAIIILLSLGYGHAFVWMIRYSLRQIHRLGRK
jgi:hypothetical protein